MLGLERDHRRLKFQSRPLAVDGPMDGGKLRQTCAPPVTRAVFVMGLLSSIVKNLKRVMAAEYSREL